MGSVSRVGRNGGEGEETPDLQDPATAAGVLARVDAQLQTVALEQARHGRMLEKICISLAIEPEKSDPPPPIRKTLESLAEEDARLKKADAETSQRLEALSEEQAQTKLIVRIGLIEGIPKLLKVGGALVAVLGVLAALAGQIWAVVHGH